MLLKITPDLVRAMLMHVSPNMPHKERVLIGMSINSEFPDGIGAELYGEWRARGDSYKENEARAEWRSFKPDGGVAIGTLIRYAQQGGYVLPKPEGEKTQLTPEQLAQSERERAERSRQAKERIAIGHDAAAGKAVAMWSAAADAGDSGYLVRKGVGAHGVRFAADGWLLVPVRDGEGRLWNVQMIAPERPADGAPEKRFLKGARKSGLWHMLGDPAGAAVILAAEGYATAASVHEATGRPVAVAFDAGNLPHVTKALRALHPDALIVVAGDDDVATAARTGSNPGRDKAQAAARSVRGLAVFPAPLPEGGSDFNDLHQSAGVDAVRELIEGAVNAHKGRSVTQAPAPAATDRLDPFLVEDSGVYYLPRDKDGNQLAPQWLCGRLEVIARTRDTDGQSWGYLLTFSDPTGRRREWAMPARMLAGDGGELRAALLGMGLSITTNPQGRNRLTEYLQTRQPEALAVCAERTGWHPIADGAAYVLPGQTLGDGAERVVFQSETPIENTFRQRGDVAAWRERVGALCVGNSLLAFAASCAFAGPLMRPGAVDSGGFHFKGDSSSGKTTALRVAASVNGGASYMQRWRTTDNALEATAAQHCDALLVLDELGQVDGRVAGECAYMLANESSKARASRNGAPRVRLTWRLLFLSAGELGLSDHMAEAMKRSRVGQEVRMVDLRADAGAGMGVFENLHGREGGAMLAHELQRATAGAYGAPGLAWLQWLAPRWTTLPRMLRERMDALRAAWVPEGASGQVERVATRFALVATAGELATEAGLTGWPQGEAQRAARRCFESWLAARGGAGNAEVTQMLRQVRKFFEANGEGRFTWWHRAADDHAVKTLARAGFRRMLNAEGEPIKSNSQHGAEFGDRMPTTAAEEVSVEYFVFAEVFKGEVCAGFDPRAVCQVLMEHGCLVPDKGRHFDCRPRLPGVGHAQCYRISPALMALDL